jgi:hypothetical protein
VNVPRSCATAIIPNNERYTNLMDGINLHGASETSQLVLAAEVILTTVLQEPD